LDSSGNYLSDVSVYSSSQPTGAKILTGSTNSTGYATFSDVKAGSYTFEVTKTGYETLHQPVNFNGAPLTMDLTLIGGSPQGDNTLITIIAVAIVAVVIAVIGIVLVKRRKPSKTLQPLNWPLKS
jgi:hypothetical protein